MISHYLKFVFAPIAMYGLEDGGHQVIEASDNPEQTELQALEERARQLAADGVDQSDVTTLLEEMEASNEGTTAEAREGQREVIISVLGDLGAQLAEGNTDGVFQAKWRMSDDRRIVHDTYAGFGGEEKQALSRNTVASLISSLGLTREEIISALGAGNEEYAEMLLSTDMTHEEYTELIEAGRAQRGPNPEQVQEIQAQADRSQRISDEDIAMSQPLVRPEEVVEEAEPEVAEVAAPTINPHPDLVEEDVVAAEPEDPVDAVPEEIDINVANLNETLKTLDITNLPPNRSQEAFALQQALVDAGYDIGSYGDNGDGVDGFPGDKTKRGLQTALVQSGYDIGSSGVDGAIGPDTQSAFSLLQEDLATGGTMVAGNSNPTDTATA